MQFSKNWLYEWVSLKSTPAELSARLTMAGLEVDSVNQYHAFKGVVVAQIIAIDDHPDSENLKVCQLQTGDEIFQVVTAATNIHVGAKLCYAPVGTHLPAIHKPAESLAKLDFKGVESFGMLLSPQEMGLAEKSESLMLLSEMAPIGEDVWNYLHLDDVIFDLDITPNRGDCLSIQGLAREVHALTKANFNPIKINAIKPNHKETLSVDIQDHKACPRYCGRVIKNVDCKKPTPDWMKEKLRRCQIRSIHPIVDVLNYVMIELGQPMHAFDLSKIVGDLSVRMSVEGESLKLLDGQTATIQNTQTLLIADESKLLAIAGVMGGDESAVNTATTNIFLESAFFAPESIAGIGRQLGVHSDSSFRFERGVDPKGQTIAIERATQWILDICGGEPGPITDIQTPFLPEKQPISFSVAHAQSLLGYEILAKDVIADLKRLQCEIKEDGKVFQVLPPSFRFDLNIQEDLVEEIARVKGYDNIEPSLPKGFCKPKAISRIDDARYKRVMVDLGYHEVITYSFVDETLQNKIHHGETQVALVNPIASDMNVMRKSMWPGLIKTALHNMHRQQFDFSLFEVGLVFNQLSGGLDQTKMLGGLCCGLSEPTHWQAKSKPFDFYAVKGHLEHLWQTSGKTLDELTWEIASHEALHPGQSAQLKYKGKPVGWVGALHPRLLASLDMQGPVFIYELEWDALVVSKRLHFEKPSAYPAVRRDLSFVVQEETTSAQIKQWLKSEGGKLLKEIVFFDIYQGQGVAQGHKSMALGLVLQDTKKTLVDHEVDKVVTHLVTGLKKNFDAQLRD